MIVETQTFDIGTDNEGLRPASTWAGPYSTIPGADIVSFMSHLNQVFLGVEPQSIISVKYCFLSGYECEITLPPSSFHDYGPGGAINRGLRLARAVNKGVAMERPEFHPSSLVRIVVEMGVKVPDPPGAYDHRSRALGTSGRALMPRWRDDYDPFEEDEDPCNDCGGCGFVDISLGNCPGGVIERCTCNPEPIRLTRFERELVL